MDIVHEGCKELTRYNQATDGIYVTQERTPPRSYSKARLLYNNGDFSSPKDGNGKIVVEGSPKTHRSVLAPPLLSWNRPLKSNPEGMCSLVSLAASARTTQSNRTPKQAYLHFQNRQSDDSDACHPAG